MDTVDCLEAVFVALDPEVTVSARLVVASFVLEFWVTGTSLVILTVFPGCVVPTEVVSEEGILVTVSASVVVVGDTWKPLPLGSSVVSEVVLSSGTELVNLMFSVVSTRVVSPNPVVTLLTKLVVVGASKVVV